MTIETGSYIFDAIVMLALAYIGSKAKKIDSLEKNLKKSNDELIESKFKILAAEFKTQVAEMVAPLSQLKAIVDQVEARLERGDKNFDQQEDNTHKLELKSVVSFHEIKNWALENFVSRKEFHEIAQALRHCEIALAKIQVSRFPEPNNN